MTTRILLLTFLILLMLPLLCLSGYAQEEISGETGIVPVPDSVKAQLTKLLPDMEKLEAKPTSEIEFYGSDLFKYIDGGASLYHDYDFVALIHRDYKKDDIDLTIDIYDMGADIKAFGVYSAERSPDYNFIEIGAEGYMDEYVLNFLQGPYYVKLSAFSEKSKTDEILKSAAQAISELIKDGKTFPDALNRFPKENLIARTQMYLNKAPLACEFLEPAYKANYLFGELKSTLVLSIANDSRDARARIEMMKARVAKNGDVQPVPDLNKTAFSGKDKYIGEMIAFAQDRYAVIFVNPPENGAEFLKKVAEGLNPKKER